MTRFAPNWIVRLLVVMAFILLSGALASGQGLGQPVVLAGSNSDSATPTPPTIVPINTAALSPAIRRLPAPVWQLGVPAKQEQQNKSIVTSASPQSPAGAELILREGFESTFPSNGWTLFDTSNDGKERLWNDVDVRHYGGSWSAWPAAAGVDGVDPASNQYPNNVDSWMIYGPFDLRNASSAQVTFWLWRALKTNDTIFFGAAADGVVFAGSDWSGTADWTPITVDLSPYLGDDTVWVGWSFHSDGSGRDVGAFVDDILITQSVQPCVAIADSYNCTITALTGWDQTPLTLQQGDQFTVAYNGGNWTMDYRNYSYVGPDGYSPAEDSQFWQGCKVDPASTYARLLGQIGNGSLFSVGSGGIFTANANGILALRINDADGCLGDNDGAIQLTLAKQPPPSAEFDAWPQSGEAPLTVSMHIVSTANMSSCAWAYGDGAVGNSCDPYHDHIYTAAGSYTVKFTASGPGGSNTMTRASYINVTRVTLPTVQLSNAGYTVNENGSTATIQVQLSGASNNAVTVNYATSNGTAIAGSDYQATNGTLIFNPGDTSKTFTVPIINDVVVDPNETVNLALSNPSSSATLGAPTSAILTIVDDEVCFTLTTSVNPSSSGSVAAAPAPNCQGNQYAQGTVVSLSATPNAGFSFSAWSGSASSAANPLSLVMDGNKNITANFNSLPINRAPVANAQSVTTAQNTALNITLRATDADNNALTYGIVSNPSHGVLSGAPPNLVYTPSSGFSGADSFTFKANDGIADSNIATVIINVTAPPTPCYTLTTTISPANGGTVAITPSPNCQGNKYTQGTQASLSATANSGYIFSQWSGSASGNQNPLALTMDGDKSITISFSAASSTNPPRLSFASKAGALGARVTVPVTYQANGNSISSLLFSVNYDETQLTFDPNLPNAIQFSPGLPASFIKQLIAFNPNDLNGALDFVLADFAQSPQPLPSGELMTITFTVKPNATVGAQAPLQLTQTSFGSTNGEVSGVINNGTITIQTANQATYLPVIRR